MTEQQLLTIDKMIQLIEPTDDDYLTMSDLNDLQSEVDYQLEQIERKELN